MEQHGLGRLRRAIEKLGLVARRVSFATGQPIPDDCAAIVEANPRTRYSPGETDVLRRYLERGGSAMFLIEPDYTLDESLAALLASAGIAVRDGVIVDPTEHYFTDEQMIAVSRYGSHSATRESDATGCQQRRQLRHRKSSGGPNKGQVRPARITDHRTRRRGTLEWIGGSALPHDCRGRCRFRLQFLLSLSGQLRRCAGRTRVAHA
jgi:hypothetical protein